MCVGHVRGLSARRGARFYDVRTAIAQDRDKIATANLNRPNGSAVGSGVPQLNQFPNTALARPRAVDSLRLALAA